MTFANGLIEKAELWLGCKEVGNRSGCVDEIHDYFDGKPIAEAWCAKFVWMVADLTAKDFRIKNYLPKEKSTLRMLDKSKGTFRVDKTPTPGAVFFRKRETGGHVGFVVEIRSNGEMITIEGNKSDSVSWGKYQQKDYASYQFIHTEEMPKLNGVKDSGTITTNTGGLIYENIIAAPVEDLLLYSGIGIASIIALGTLYKITK